MEETNTTSKPYKICDASRSIKKGVVASSLEDLIQKLPEKLGRTEPSETVTIVLENDGTEVDEEDYFSTLEENTCLMALYDAEKWTSEIPQCHITLDTTDDASGQRRLPSLVGQLKQNICHVSVLGGPDLELLSDMDPDSVADILFPNDKEFLETLKEASGRILCEKRQAQDAMELLNLYHKSVQATNEEATNGVQPEMA